MTINDILLFVKDRTGEQTQDYVLREIKYVVTRLWAQTDLPGSLRTMDVKPYGERFVILPWFVAELRGVRRVNYSEISLNTISHSFTDNHAFQWPMTWRSMDTTPLLKTYTNIGRLTLKLRKPADETFTVKLVGPGEYGVRDEDEVTFNAGDTEHTMTRVLKDVEEFGKNVSPLRTDVMLYDINGECIGILPSHLDSVQNQRIQVTDEASLNPIDPNGQCFKLLFKLHPPVFSSPTQTIHPQFGEIVRNFVVAQILAKSGETSAMNRMKFHGEMAETAMESIVRQENKGRQIGVSLSRSPFDHEFIGYL